MRYEIDTLEIYKKFYIKRLRIEDDVYYLVYDENDCKHGGRLSSVESCRKWIDVICSDNRKKRDKKKGE